ncbi:MAG: DUF4374 domain-containing protein [Dysgonamonadaceae bacterium]|jgi:hypothetical protein|nr:DUF4374 domain-containing protein [Dysgonamonadaceae bacterium]
MITNFKQSVSARLLAICCACLPFVFVSCNKNDDPKPEPEKKGAFFIAATGESTQYILQVDNPETGTTSISNNIKTLELSGYTWIFNSNPSAAVGLIYQQGDPGVGLGYVADENGSLRESGQFLITSRFTSYGFFDRYALTSVGGVTPVDGQGNALLDAGGNNRTDGVTFNFFDLKNNFASQTKTIPTLNITGNGQQATPSGIVDMGNGEFLTGLVVSEPKDPTAGGGASSGAITYPDSVWVAAFDANLNLKRIYRDDRIGYSSGRFRSQYYSQIAKADDGNVYVFSGAYESTTTRPAGVLRINSGATAFDASYYFDIQEKTGGYKFRKVWHITGNYFLLELYNDLVPAATGAATQYGVVDVIGKTFKWVTGIPALDKITATGLPAPHNGKMYFPITAEAADPAIYVINPTTAAATKGLTVTGATSINAIGRLTHD